MNPAVVITNAGPLIALAKLNLLHLLEPLYGRVQQLPLGLFQV